MYPEVSVVETRICSLVGQGPFGPSQVQNYQGWRSISQTSHRPRHSPDICMDLVPASVSLLEQYTADVQSSSLSWMFNLLVISAGRLSHQEAPIQGRGSVLLEVLPSTFLPPASLYALSISVCFHPGRVELLPGLSRHFTYAESAHHVIEKWPLKSGHFPMFSACSSGADLILFLVLVTSVCCYYFCHQGF